MYIFCVALQRMVLVGAKICSELTYNEWVERNKERKKERRKERKKEGKKERNITILYIFFALFCRGWLFFG